jgi:hypothetical protein
MLMASMPLSKHFGDDCAFVFETKAWLELDNAAAQVREFKEDWDESMRSCVQQPTQLAINLSTESSAQRRAGNLRAKPVGSDTIILADPEILHRICHNVGRVSYERSESPKEQERPKFSLILHVFCTWRRDSANTKT